MAAKPEIAERPHRADVKGGSAHPETADSEYPDRRKTAEVKAKVRPKNEEGRNGAAKIKKVDVKNQPLKSVSNAKCVYCH